jgi:uncharacterized protein YggE
MKKQLLFLACLLLSYSLSAQMSGNQIYANHHNNNYRPNIPSQGTNQFNNGSLSIQVNLMLEKTATTYRLTVGANQEEKSVEACDKKINTRINKLTKRLQEIGIQNKGIYVDFISQTKIYDYSVNQQQSTQIENGFEIKKNIIIQFDELDLVDQIISACADSEIYDIIKLDYIDLDREKAYAQLYEEALKLAKERKDFLMKHHSGTATGRFKISTTSFSANYPKNLYKTYQAFESSQLNIYQKRYGNNYINKEARKNKTFYYDGIDFSQFDKVILLKSPTVGIQYVMSMTVVFELETAF